MDHHNELQNEGKKADIARILGEASKLHGQDTFLLGIKFTAFVSPSKTCLRNFMKTRK